MEALDYAEFLLFLAGSLIGAFLHALYSRAQRNGSDALQAGEIAHYKERLEAQDSEIKAAHGQVEVLRTQIDSEREATRELDKRLTAAETRSEQIIPLSQRLETAEKQRDELAVEGRKLSAQIASSEEKLQHLARTEQRLAQKKVPLPSFRNKRRRSRPR